METLLIRILNVQTTDEPAIAEWLVIGSNRLPSGEAARGALADAATAAPHRRTVVLAPSENILLTRVDIKARSRDQLARAMPFALEEELAEDVDQLHFAAGPRQEDGSYPVAVVAHAQMSEWLTQLGEAGLTPQALIADVLALPEGADGGWSLLLEQDRALLRTGSFNGFTLEPVNLDIFLNGALEEATSPAEVIDVYACHDDTQGELPSLPATRYERRDGCPPLLWAAGLDERRGINLLQARYRLKSDVGRLLKPWRAAAALAAVWLLVQVTAVSLEYRRLAAEAQALEADVAQVYRDTFPGTTRIVNARVQMEQQLQALRQASERDSQSAFMALLYGAAGALQAVPGISIETLDYLGGRLELSLNARELQAFETMKRTLEGEGLVANIESAETRGANVSGRLTVRQARG
jgi:general secretion pathway protein L